MDYKQQKERYQKAINDKGLNKYWEDQDHTDKLFEKGQKILHNLTSYQNFSNKLKQLNEKIIDSQILQFEKCLVAGEQFQLVKQCFAQNASNDSQCKVMYDSLFKSCFKENILKHTNEFFFIQSNKFNQESCKLILENVNKKLQNQKINK